MVRKQFIVLDPNARYAGGRPVKNGVVALTDNEAEHDLRNRVIKPFVPEMVAEAAPEPAPASLPQSGVSAEDGGDFHHEDEGDGEGAARRTKRRR